MTDPTRRADPQTIAAAEVEALSAVDCWLKLEDARRGRLALSTEDGVDIFPVNYIARGERIYLCSGPGSKMFNIVRHPQVAFEIEGHDHGRMWSVVVHGRAERMNLDADIEASGVLAIHADHPGAKNNYVQITPTDITGRSFRVSGRSDALAAATLGMVPVKEDQD
jgi:nitroimidazol reductase NimA-like FMN-containing flavoprotein (pyridoxamine 5'-phosphate oxidase superfamily)